MTRLGTSTTVLLVASGGGHLLELLELADSFPPEERHWVTFDRSDARALLGGETISHAFSPTNRNLKNLVRNGVLAWRLIWRLRPRAVISTGAGAAVPFLIAGRLLGSRTIYVESLARIEALSLSGKLVYPFTTDFFVQWPELDRRLPRIRYVGAIIDLAQTS